MKKTVLFTIGALLLCGGLLGLHLAAQTARNAFSPSDKDSLLHRKLEECSERELLELKVASHRKRVENITARYNSGSSQDSITRLAESQADLASAEIELYRYTGEQDKLRTALKTRVETLTAKLAIITKFYESIPREVIIAPDLYEAEIQLLDALLEQKREK